jgi:hypothetical protein
MGEQSELLKQMLLQAEASVKELSEKAVEWETSEDQNMVGLEGAVLEVVLRLGAVWLGMMLSQRAAQLAAKARTRRPCGCGGMARWVEWRSKAILTLLGRLTYGRVYFHCAQCGKGEGLGDRQWGLYKTRTSPGVKQLLGYLSGTTVGFVTVAHNVCRTLRWPQQWLSGKQVQRLAEPVGKLLGAREAARVAQWWTKVTAGLSVALEDEAPPAYGEGNNRQGLKAQKRLYVQMDGIMGRVRDTLGKGSDVWREVKVGVVFWAEPGRHASTLAELRGVGEVGGERGRVWVDRPQGAITYVAGLLPAAQFGIRLYAEAVGRGLERAGEVVVLRDGAIWIWKLVEEHFPEAVQILDFHHARERVWAVAHAVWGEGSAKAAAWAETQISEHLICGDVEGLVGAIAVLSQIAPPCGESKSIPEQAREYFQNNAARMDYPAYRARGMEIGSGIAESSGRRVVGVRCKQPGMRWTEEGLSAIVGLRTLALNNRYDSALANLRKAS